MRHLVRGRQLSRTSAHKKALMKNLVTALMREERIVTTVQKAKELRQLADRCVTYAKKGSLHHRRLAARYVNDPDALRKLFDTFATRYATRPGGYTRIMKIGWRKGDAADMAIIELMPEGETKPVRVRKTPVAAAAVTTKEKFAE